jgi:hypothetical protein
MKRRMQIALALAAAGLAGGGAVAAAESRADDPAAERDAFLEDAADRLGVEPDELERALEEAAVARVDAAVAAGRLGEEEAAALKERIRTGRPLVPGLGLHGPGRHGFVHSAPFLEPAAEYLGVEPEVLRSRLAEGESLAEIAEAEGKSVDGLVDALVAAVQDRVEDDREQLAKRLRERIEALVEGELPDQAELPAFPRLERRWDDGA